MKKYVLGFDFGTLSCRGVAIDLADGNVAATAESVYQNGVISGQMRHKPIPLKNDWFLQDPDDWVNSMGEVCRDMLQKGHIAQEQVLGIGTDFTCCTLLPIVEDGTPLCKLAEFRDRPNAWPKLWKHHGAQAQAERIEAYAKEHTTWLKEYFGNSVSSEWAYPKMLQVLQEDPDIYRAADYFIEAVDWIVMKLTGENTRTNGNLGINEFYIEGRGFPSREFAGALHPEFADVAETKLAGRIVKVGDCVGTVTAEMAEFLGVSPATAVAAGHGDSAVTGCGVGINKSGSIILVMGTSTCHQLMYREFRPIDGICSVAADGMIPGLYSYECGQPATGDVFQWFVDNLVPHRYQVEAERRGQSLLGYMGELAERIKPGASGLVALDWLNGNRSILSDYNLSGLILGLTLDTKPEEIYRALVEANIFGSRRILENYEENGLSIIDVYAVGGIAGKSSWIMQMCADVFKREIIVPEIDNVSARGAAACAAVAVGQKYGKLGCADFEETSARLIPKRVRIYYPNADMSARYDRVYTFYRKLHDLFGSDGSFMKNLKELRNEAADHE